MMLPPLPRALIACAIFAAFALYAFFHTPPSAALTPLCIYYAVLVLNTFFSVRLFATITPPSPTDTIFDLVLVVAYASLAFSFYSVVAFAAASTVLFVLSIGKYWNLLRLIPHRAFLLRKIRINILGVALSIAALVLAGSGYELLAAWLLAGLFSLGNAYVLAINPMYRLER